jgi:dipeptidyl aminopeptidase/acylaminoacyl peptidase
MSHSTPAGAAPGPGSAARRPFTVEDLWAIRRVGTPAPLPDGSALVVPVTSYDMAKNEGASRLWLYPLGAEGGRAAAPRPLTAAEVSSTEPRVSPDGRRLAFVRRAVKEKGQLYLMPLDGGEAERLTDMPLGVLDPRWFPDGKRIAFLAPILAEAPAVEATRALLAEREKDPVKARVTEDRIYRYWDHWLTGGEVHHLFVLDLETREIRDLIPESRAWFDLMDPAGGYDIAPDGAELAFSANASAPPYQALNYDIFAVPAAGGAIRNITADNPADDVRPRYTPDGRAIVFGMQREVDFYADRVRLVRHDRATGESEVLTEGWDRSAADWEIGPDGRTIAFLAEDRGRVSLFTLDLDAAARAARAGEAVAPALRRRGGHVGAPRWVGRDRLAYTVDALAAPPEVHVAGSDGAGERRVTRENDALLAGIALGGTTEIEFAGAGGAPVQMFVLHPPGFDPAQKWPLVHLVHGGPHGIFGDQFHFRWNAQLFAAPGYVVAMVNFHGSTSFGQDFAASILGAHGERPFADVMAATDRLLATGYIDEKRMAAAGGSYGGYLTSWIGGHTDRFACLVNHAGVYDTLSQYASDVTLGRARAYGGEPWTDLAAIDRWNPARFAAGFTSPMLVVHGELDYRVPHTQGLAVYGVLKAKGVPARLVFYPDENHWVLKPQNSRHWYGEVLGWLARFLAPAGSAA